jgi:hypothetical protein
MWASNASMLVRRTDGRPGLIIIIFFSKQTELFPLKKRVLFAESVAYIYVSTKKIVTYVSAVNVPCLTCAVDHAAMILFTYKKIFFS